MINEKQIQDKIKQSIEEHMEQKRIKKEVNRLLREKENKHLFENILGIEVIR